MFFNIFIVKFVSMVHDSFILKTYKGKEVVSLNEESGKTTLSKIAAYKRRLFNRGIKNAEFSILV